MDCASLLNPMGYPRDYSQLCYTFGLIVGYKSNGAKPEETWDFHFFHSDKQAKACLIKCGRKGFFNPKLIQT